MRRRDFLPLLAGLIGGRSATGHAQQKAMPVIGWLHSLSADHAAPVIAAFGEGLREAGYVAGKNVAIEYRWAEGDYDRLPALAADLVGRKVNVILTGGGTKPILAAKDATLAIPVVFAVATDPVGSGIVESFARPGGNVTGISFLGVELVPKRLELLSDLEPRAKVFGLLVNPKMDDITLHQIENAREAAQAKGVQVHVLNAETEAEIDAAFAALAKLHADALIVGDDAFLYHQRDQLAALASRYSVPAIYSLREQVVAGGLVSYGTSLPGAYRQAAALVGKILAGAKPADLPVQQPTTFELVVNLKTAAALGLTVPPSVLARATEVIE
jgi:putative tryptophan/tyrosine transport system substrate-binding protein